MNKPLITQEEINSGDYLYCPYCLSHVYWTTRFPTKGKYKAVMQHCLVCKNMFITESIGPWKFKCYKKEEE